MGWIKERAFMQRRHVYITLCFLLILGRMMKWRSLLGEEEEAGEEKEKKEKGEGNSRKL